MLVAVASLQTSLLFDYFAEFAKFSLGTARILLNSVLLLEIQSIKCSDEVATRNASSECQAMNSVCFSRQIQRVSIWDFNVLFWP